MLKLDKSSDVKLEQPWNIPAIVVTFEVSKPDTSNDVKPEQLENIEFIIVTLSVTFRYSTLNKLVFPLKEQLEKSSSLSIILVVTVPLTSSV